MTDVQRLPEDVVALKEIIWKQSEFQEELKREAASAGRPSPDREDT